MELEEWEHVTCLKNVSLAYEGTRSGLKGYIAVGTNYNYGEDITSRGRVRTYQILTQNVRHKVIVNFCTQLYMLVQIIVSSFNHITRFNRPYPSLYQA